MDSNGIDQSGVLISEVSVYTNIVSGNQESDLNIKVSLFQSVMIRGSIVYMYTVPEGFHCYMYTVPERFPSLSDYTSH